MGCGWIEKGFIKMRQRTTSSGASLTCPACFDING
jgi:hypothetical protein